MYVIQQRNTLQFYYNGKDYIHRESTMYRLIEETMLHRQALLHTHKFDSLSTDLHYGSSITYSID